LSAAVGDRRIARGALSAEGRVETGRPRVASPPSSPPCLAEPTGSFHVKRSLAASAVRRVGVVVSRSHVGARRHGWTEPHVNALALRWSSRPTHGQVCDPGPPHRFGRHNGVSGRTRRGAAAGKHTVPRETSRLPKRRRRRPGPSDSYVPRGRHRRPGQGPQEPTYGRPGRQDPDTLLPYRRRGRARS
jgi:hypothetical protein